MGAVGSLTQVGDGPGKRDEDKLGRGVGGTGASAATGSSIAGTGAPTPLAASRRERRTPCTICACVSESGDMVIKSTTGAGSNEWRQP